ncbi:MAG: DinB family protein, partial [Candidatus Hydrogenedentes bacterium]|nr:DinB family protein [Candidatus Hydrogenedentota bacterium]
MEQTHESSYLRNLHERLVKSCERATSLAVDVNPDQLNWKPGDDQWSIAQCLEHVLLAADLYGEKIGPAIERARGKRLHASGDLQPRHTIMGRLILRAVEPTAKRTMSSPKSFAPSQSKIPDDVLDRYIRSHENL